MTTPKQPASLPEDEEMDPVGEPYQTKSHLGRVMGMIHHTRPSLRIQSLIFHKTRSPSA